MSVTQCVVIRVGFEPTLLQFRSRAPLLDLAHVTLSLGHLAHLIILRTNYHRHWMNTCCNTSYLVYGYSLSNIHRRRSFIMAIELQGQSPNRSASMAPYDGTKFNFTIERFTLSN